MKILTSIVFFCLAIYAYAEEPSVSELDKQVKQLLSSEAAITLSVQSCAPMQRITNLMGEIDKIGQQLMKREQTEESIALSEKCLAILAALRERRVFAYMLWAEGCLEKSSVGRYANLSTVDQHTLMALYGKLSEINISIVRESMLNREIMGRLAEIYDCLTPENKKKVRVNAILQQRDALTNISNIPRRKTLDDF
jgi:hypothetical protein